MAKTPTTIDASARLAELLPEKDVDDIPYTVLKGGLFGDGVRILQDINVFSALQMDDDASYIAKLMTDVVHPDDRDKLNKALRAQRRLDAPALMGVFEIMMEAATGGRPTNSPSGSSAGTAKKAAVRRSAAS